MTGPAAPVWATGLSAGAPAEVVARCVCLAATPGMAPDRLRDAVARLLDAGEDPDAPAVLTEIERDRRLDLPPGDRAAQALLAAGARVHVVGYPPYPRRLASAWPQLGAPLWLFVRSREGGLPDGPAVAVVGTRRPTLDGLETARALGRLLADRHVTVVSGMARGIDQAAHRGALDVGGPTVAVLGTGLDVDYPARDGRLRDAVAEAGGLVTEYLPGSGPRPAQFLWRNRVIAGLADATVVVEGGARSGALHTARLAGAQGREVLAVPGSINQPTSRGPLDLIRDGAVPVTRLDDVLAAIGLDGRGLDDGGLDAGAGCAARDAGVDDSRGGLDGAAGSVWSLVGSMPARPGQLAAATGLRMPVVMAAIGELVARGLVHHTPHGITRAAPQGIIGPPGR